MIYDGPVVGMNVESWISACPWCWNWCCWVVLEPSTLDPFATVEEATRTQLDREAGVDLAQEAVDEHVETCRPDLAQPADLERWLAS